MPSTITVLDRKLAQLLNSLELNEDYSAFRGQFVREHMHTLFQYPAMMIPQMQGELIEKVLQVNSEIKGVYDPFVGAGTVMVEAMSRGLDFTGQDINPLAILICQVKSGPFFVEALQEKIEYLRERLRKDRGERIEADFAGLNKWFKPEVAVELSQLRRAIRGEPALWCRRFFWVALAETVRLTSNSRTSTFKIHTRPADEIKNWKVSPKQVFDGILGKNTVNLSLHRDLLVKHNLLKKGRYQGVIDIVLGDSSKSPQQKDGKQDLLVTSPPYGDNKTTVPYGQHSYFPLQWIDLADIAESLDSSCLATTHEIDTRSLGGRTKNAVQATTALREVSPNFANIMKELANEPSDRSARVAAFYRDLYTCIKPIMNHVSDNTYMIWTVGNRRVGARQIPTDRILQDMLCANGAVFVTRIQRRIPSKRMAHRNIYADTMNAETILVMRKADI